MNGKKHISILLIVVVVIAVIGLTGCRIQESDMLSADVTENPVVMSVEESPETEDTTTTPTPPSPVPEIRNLLSQEAYRLIQENRDNPDFMIIDVRTEGEFAAGHIEGAVNINVGLPSFSEEIGKLDRDGIYLVYCRTGNRSYGAVTMMQDMDFQNIYHLVYGITEWINAGYPVVQPE